MVTAVIGGNAITMACLYGIALGVRADKRGEPFPKETWIAIGLLLLYLACGAMFIAGR